MVVARICDLCGSAYWHGPVYGHRDYCRPCNLQRKRARQLMNRDHEYGETWPAQRKAAKERDGWQCQECELRQQECREAYGVGLHVHHVEPYESFDSDEEAHRLENLQTLCPSCHARRERE